MTRIVRQDVFFDIKEQQECNWGYAIECRLALDIPMEDAAWQLFKTMGVCHFRTEAEAEANVKTLNEVYKRQIELGLIEFRAVLKYLGYVPESDEAWIK